MESGKTYRDAPGSDIKLPKEVYHRCLWIVRDRSRLERLASVLDYDGENTWDGGFAEDVSVVTDAAARHAAYELECIDSALESIPEVYKNNAAKFSKLGFLEINSDGIRLMPKGFLVSNYIISEILG